MILHITLAIMRQPPSRSTKPCRLRWFQRHPRRSWCGSWSSYCSRSITSQTYHYGFLRRWCYSFSVRCHHCLVRLPLLYRKRTFCCWLGWVRSVSWCTLPFFVGVGVLGISYLQEHYSTRKLCCQVVFWRVQSICTQGQRVYGYI